MLKEALILLFSLSYLFLLLSYIILQFCYFAPCETTGLRAEPSLSQKGDPRTAGPVD